jgi:hypothetical protein
VTERCAEITVFTKRGGPLTKHIELVDGSVANDSSACSMGSGVARRVQIQLNDIVALAQLINGLGPREAYAIGRLKEGLPDKVRIVVADKLANFHGDPGVAARTKEHLAFVEGAPAICLLDVDVKGMSEAARRRIGRVWEALCAVVPLLTDVARVTRRSTASGLRNKDTGQPYPDSGGFHCAIAVADGADIPRFLSDFHDRLWLAGLGWGMISAAGSFLERALVDKACGSPERLIFEAPPIVIPPLEQGPRLAEAIEGAILDTRAACPPLTATEKVEAQKLKEAERLRLKPKSDEQRAKWSDGHIKRLVASGMPEPWARAQVDRWLDHQELSGDFPLPFDDPKLAGATVADVLDHPANFINKTLADPFEGPSYGKGKARIYQRQTGSLLVNSFAHGGAQYELKAAPQPEAPTSPSALPPIELRVGETEKIVNEIERRLLACNRSIFQHAGAIVCTGFAQMPTWDKGTVITQIIAARGDYALVEDLEAVAGFLHFNKKGKLVPCSPPMRLIYTLKDREHRLRFPVLVGIVNCPSISADGELLDRPGYDQRTGILFDPLGVTFPRLPDFPSGRQAEAALKRLLRLIETFDFISEDDRAVALSLFLTIIARRGLPFVPLHGFDAPVAGSGKSKIVDIASILATGHEAGVVSLGKNQEEAEKRLSSMLMRGDPLIAIDNLDQPLQGALLNQALTQQQVELRILGLSKMVVARTSALITATGNNLIVKGDMTRRGVVGRLDPKVERPELRSFNYDPIADAKQNRGELVVAALTILKAYHNAGRPNRPSPLQSFTHWSDTVRGALIWLGMGDPVKTMLRLRKTDPTTSNLKAVLTAWRDQFGDEATSSAAVVAKAEETITFEAAVGSDEKIRRHAHPSLREALLMVAGKSGRIDIRALGQWLGKSAGRVINLGEDGANDFVALEEGTLLHGARRWWVIQK